MHEKPSELEVGDVSASSAFPEVQVKRNRRRRRTDWRLGGRAVGRWDFQVLVIALVGAGFGILFARVIAGLAIPGTSLLSLVALWVGLLVAVVFAVVRSRPAGLFRFRAVDLLWGVGLGLGLRVLEGVLSGANTSAFPSESDAGSSLQHWLLTQAIPAGVFGPVIEEAFFRMVLLVTIFQLLRRSSGSLAAGVAATLASVGAFVSLHAVFGELTLANSISLFAVGAVCAALVLLTGRIWGALLLHVVYNVIFLIVVLVGARLS